MAVIHFSYGYDSPVRAIQNVVYDERAVLTGTINLGSSYFESAELWAKQMLFTQAMFNKAIKPNNRKYYIFRVFFHPNDRKESGGPMDVSLAQKYIYCLVPQIWPENEVVWTIYDNTDRYFVYLVVNPVSAKTGKTFKFSRKDWWIIKNTSDGICKQLGIHFVEPQDMTESWWENQ